MSDSRSRERCPKGSGITPGNKQFHTEGFVNTYMQQPSADDKTIVFVSEAIENIQTGYRARETYTIMSRDEFTERFEIAEPGQDFEVYSEARLKRVR